MLRVAEESMNMLEISVRFREKSLTSFFFVLININHLFLSAQPEYLYIVAEH